MTIRRVCDVCDSTSSKEIHELPMGWIDIKVTRRTSPGDTVIGLVDALHLECCSTCGELLADGIKSLIGDLHGGTP